MNALLANLDAKIDEKIEKQLQPKSFHITEISSKQINQDKIFSTYENCLDKMSNNNKISTKFDTSRK